MSAIITYPDTELRHADTSKIVLDKILQALNNGAGCGGSGSGDAGGGTGQCPACNFIGAGSPEGVQAGAPGSRYYDTTNDDHYIKTSGSGNTGWFAYIA